MKQEALHDVFTVGLHIARVARTKPSQSKAPGTVGRVATRSAGNTCPQERPDVEPQGAGPYPTDAGAESSGQGRHEQGCGSDRVDRDRVGRANRSRPLYAVTTAV